LSAATATLLIATYNRAAYLKDTLASIAELRTPRGLVWDVVVVDNNSGDDTREIVAAAAQRLPVPLIYIFERRQGKAIALNTALTAISSSLILFTDDDVRLPAGWLEAAVRPLRERPDIAYVGGPVRPLWGGEPPRWLLDSTRSAGVLATLDYGPQSFCFEDRRLIPVGVNMAVRRSIIEAAGGFHAGLDRTGTALLGQGQAEFFARCRRIGARGLYVPDMGLEHLVPADRLAIRYFLRWWFWKGVSQARWYRIHDETELGVDLRNTSKLLGISRFIYGDAVRECLRAAWMVLRGRLTEVPDRLAALAFFVGYARETWFGPRNLTQGDPAESEKATVQTNAAVR
jgi:glycosyltransferase involved in cell wall biosynthesis